LSGENCGTRSGTKSGEGSPKEGARSTSKRVVVMDDSPVVLLAVRACLDEAGYTTAAAANLAELEVAILDGPPDLFVLDVQMPEMYGDDVAQVLLHVRSLKVPMVLFSDIDDDLLAERGREAGVTAWVSKREGLEALLSKVESLVGKP
jgi:CheY-like chemotaxis protein